MTITLLVAAMLLVGGVSIGILVTLAIGIHSYGRSRSLADAPRTYPEIISRKVLGVTTSVSNPGRGESKES
jgi:hypothetical protein